MSLRSSNQRPERGMLFLVGSKSLQQKATYTFYNNVKPSTLCISFTSREIRNKNSRDKTAGPPVTSIIHRPTEAAHSPAGLRVLHELRSERQPRATCDVVLQQRQPEHKRQLPYYQCVRSVLHTHPQGWTQGHRGVQGRH